MSTETELIANNSLLAKNALPEHDYLYQLSQKQRAIDDFKQGLQKWRVWLLLAYHDIKVRYLRSILGPFWITLSMAITVYSMGYLYGHLFRVDLPQYYPYIVSSMLTWTLISTVLIELTDVFMSYQGQIKEIKLPYSLYIHRVIARNIIIFFHNVIVLIPIYIIFYDTAKINYNTLLVIPGLMIIYINAFIYGMILAIFGSRFRDVSQIIKSIMQVIFFVTPVMWTPAILSEHSRPYVNLNPFYAFLELVRAPLQGNMPSLCNLAIATLISIIGFILCARLFILYRARIIYWV